MSDLAGGVGGGLPSGSAGNGRSYQNGAHSAAAAAPPATTGPHSGVRTPTDIMRQRRERDARKKAEQEAREQQQQQHQQQQREQEQQQQQRLHQEAEEKRKLQQQQQERQYQQQRQQQQQQQQQAQHAAGVAGETQRRPGMTPSRPPEMPLPEDPGPRPQQHVRTGSLPTGTQTTRPAQTAPAQTATTSRPQGAQQQTRQRTGTVPSSQPPSQPQPTQPKPAGVAQPEQQTQGPPGGEPSQPSQTQTQAQQQGKSRGFPHAFERWEMLSSHWEGLTGYWIRRLEQNNEEVNRDPLSQQMSRQITDLSAAGANLFHAVVELQRLRASSERKFQRWFFDTRAEQERNQEQRAELEAQLKAERESRTVSSDAIKEAENDKLKAEEMAREMRRELQISKEEARRAWEELGRREQEERERTAALRNGEPTIVGGVQVVPMMTGVPSRQVSGSNRPPTREGGAYPGGGQVPMRMTGQDPTQQYMYQGQASASSPPSGSDPFVETTRSPGRHQYAAQPLASGGGTAAGTEVGSKAAAAMQAQTLPPDPQQHGEPSRGRFYQHQEPLLHGGADTRASDADDVSYVQSTEGAASDAGTEEYASGNPGERVTYPPSISEDSDDYEEEEMEGYDGHEHGAGATSTRPEEVHSGYGQSVDYSGAGWGVGGTWDSVTPRHRHPTRLSDVLEEDERSRTSASRASQASRTVH